MDRIEFAHLIDTNETESFDKIIINYFDQMILLYNLVSYSFSSITHYSMTDDITFNIYLDSSDNCSRLKSVITPEISIRDIIFDISAEQNENILEIKMIKRVSG